MRACPIMEKGQCAPTADFGLYADSRWQGAPWPHEVIDWPDFGMPADADVAAAQIRSAWDRAVAGELVEVGCMGAIGRTGTILACMAVLAGVAPGDAVAWVRANYRPNAVETEEQRAWVAQFATRWSADH